MKKILTTLFITVCLTFKLVAQESPKSKVVLFRTFSIWGGIIGYDVFADTTKISRFKPQTFKVLEIDAKPIRISAKTEVERHLDIDFKPNHIYFIRGKVGIGLLIGRPQFETLTVNEFKSLVARKKYLRRQLRESGYKSVDDLIKPHEVLNFTSL